MFTIKKGLQEAMQVFTKHKSQLLAFTFGWVIIIASTFYFSYIYGFVIFAVIFIFLPLELSLATIAKKAYDNVGIENRDFYLGFKALMISISLYAKTMLKGFLWALLVGFILSVIGSGIALIWLAPELIELADYNAVIVALFENKQLVDALTFVSLISFSLAGVVYNLKSYSGQITPYVLLETGFDVNSCKIISDKMTENDKKLIVLSKLMFYVYYVVAMIIGIVLSYFLIQSQLLSDIYSTFIGFFVAAALIGPVHILSNLYYGSLYRSKYQEGVRQQFQDFINVQMRISQQEFLKQNPTDDSKKPDSKKDENDKDKTEK